MGERRGVISGLIQAGALIVPMMNARLRHLGVSAMDAEVLRLLDVEPGASCAVLARRLRITRQSMQELLRDLARRALIEGTYRRDGRLAVCLSASGRSRLSEINALFDEAELQLFRCPDEQRALLARLLEGCIRDLLYEGSPLAFAMRR